MAVTRTIKVPKMVNGQPTAEVEEIKVEDYGNTEWGPKDKHKFVNTKVPRVDAPYKTTGTARYTHDVRLPGMLHARFVTSPYAHARIDAMDTAPAAKLEGVKAVMPIVEVGGEVPHEGRPIAVVAATTPELAEDAARAVLANTKFTKLPHVVTAEQALKPDAPQVVAPGGRGGGGARGGGAGQGTPEQAAEALSKSDATIDVTYRTPILHHACLETHSAVADYRGGAEATVYCSIQGTSNIPADSARELGLANGSVTGMVEHMGGGFGAKTTGINIVGIWACRLAKELKTPVKLVLTRREEFLTSGNGMGGLFQVKAGTNKDGTLTVVQANQYALSGISGGNLQGLPYQYVAQTVNRTARTLNTHEDGNVPLRAPGCPQTSFANESMMDELAYKIGMDPIAFRKKNLPDNANGAAWVRQLDTGAKAIGWENRNKTPGALKGPLVRGMGCAIGAWAGGGRGGNTADVTIRQDGTVEVTCGSQDLGTGTRTYVRSIVAEELGLEMTNVVEKIGNSALGAASASGGSTTSASLAPAVKDAAYKTRVELAKLVAPLLGTDADGVWFDKGRVVGGGKSLTWKQACATVPAAGLVTRGTFQQPLASSGTHGVSFAEVEVDIETGHVRVTKMCHVQDGGLILNRLAAESQINGGMIQSIGMALYEGRVMDPELGLMLNPAFNDYKMMGCMEIPELIPILDDGDERNGVIGIAEPANIPGCGAVANAVYNACGVRVRTTPITPDKILDGLIQMRRANV